MYFKAFPRTHLLNEDVFCCFGYICHIKFNYLTMKRKDEDFVHYDMKYDPILPLKVFVANTFAPAYPFGFLHWEGLEKEATTDKVVPGVPTLEDLGVTLTNMEDQVPWELKPYRAYQYYNDTIGEFPKPPPPKVQTI